MHDESSIDSDDTRRPLGDVMDVARALEASLAKVRGVQAAAIVGSIRRRRDTIGDIDLLVATNDFRRVANTFAALPEVQSVLARSPTMTRVRLSHGLDGVLWAVRPESFGAALVHFTGSRGHDVALRKIARRKGLVLNEYGLFRGTLPVAGRTEEGVYAALGMSFVPPEVREDTGEVELAIQGRLPDFVRAFDIRGDLQVHADWKNQPASIEAMAQAARDLGREYVVISLPVTAGMDAHGLRERLAAIREVDRGTSGIAVLAGAKVDVRPDGSLEAEDAPLAELDIVGAAVHSHVDQPRHEMTRRLVGAVENPDVHVLFHPTNRSLRAHRPADIDFTALLAACARTGTVLELSSQPHRLDLPAPSIRRAVEAGVRIAIGSDAHDVEELRYVETYGLQRARRGWAEAQDVINTLPIGEMLALLRAGAGGGAPRRLRKLAR